MPSTEVIPRPAPFEVVAAPASSPPAVVDAAPVAIAPRDLRPLPGEEVDAAPAPRTPRRIDRLFVATVAAPALAAAVALFGVAADRYTSEARFVVRASGGAAAVGPDAAAPLSRAGDDAFVVDDFIRSRDALAEIEGDPALAAALDRPEADVFFRFPAVLSAPTREDRFGRFRAMVRTEVDGTTGLGTVQVTAFRPDDARDLARALLRSAEGMVNRINDRANRDRLVFATDVLARAEAGVTDVERRLTAFRGASGTVDPAREYAAALGNVGRLTLDASQRQAALDGQVALTPNGPGVASQRETVRALRDEIARQNRQIAGGDGSLASKFESYERLAVDRDLAVKALASASLGLDASRREANRQHLYLQTVAAPNRPDAPGGPRRVFILAAVAAAGLLCWLGLRQLKELAEDHVA